MKLAKDQLVRDSFERFKVEKARADKEKARADKEKTRADKAEGQALELALKLIKMAENNKRPRPADQEPNGQPPKKKASVSDTAANGATATADAD